MLTTKKLSDYLPLYTGCKVIINSGAFNITGGIGRLVGCTESRSLVNYKDDLLPIEIVDIKPILRPFSDMTKEEKEENYRLTVKQTQYEATRYLLKLGIDIFGLIDAGLAICSQAAYLKAAATPSALQQKLDEYGLSDAKCGDWIGYVRECKQHPKMVVSKFKELSKEFESDKLMYDAALSALKKECYQSHWSNTETEYRNLLETVTPPKGWLSQKS